MNTIKSVSPDTTSITDISYNNISLDARVASITNNSTSLSESNKNSKPISMNDMAVNPSIKWMMQMFMENMYSSVEECPYAIEIKQEW